MDEGTEGQGQTNMMRDGTGTGQGQKGLRKGQRNTVGHGQGVE